MAQNPSASQVAESRFAQSLERISSTARNLFSFVENVTQLGSCLEKLYEECSGAAELMADTSRKHEIWIAIENLDVFIHKAAISAREYIRTCGKAVEKAGRIDSIKHDLDQHPRQFDSLQNHISGVQESFLHCGERLKIFNEVRDDAKRKVTDVQHKLTEEGDKHSIKAHVVVAEGVGTGALLWSVLSTVPAQERDSLVSSVITTLGTAIAAGAVGGTVATIKFQTLSKTQRDLFDGAGKCVIELNHNLCNAEKAIDSMTADMVRAQDALSALEMEADRQLLQALEDFKDEMNEIKKLADEHLEEVGKVIQSLRK